MLSPFLNLSMAISASEEGPIEPSIAFKNPEIFTKDIFAQNNKYLMWTSSTKWVPALFYKYINLDPKFFHFIFIYSQTTVLLIAVYFLSKSLSNNSKTGIISVLLTIILSPYFNNLGSYGDLYFMPYSTWISIPPLLFCIAFLINKKFKKSVLCFILGLSIHPAMAITVFGFIFATILKEKSLTNKQKFKLSIVYSIPILIFSFIIILIQKFGSAELVPISWVLESKKLFHWSAWKLDPLSSSFQTTTYTICLFAATYLAVIYFKFLGKYIRTLTFSYLIVVLISVIIQALTYTMNLRGLYTINFSRITIFMSIFSTIIFSNILNREIFENRKLMLTSPILISFILVQSYSSLILFSGVMLILIYRRESRKFYKNLVKFFAPILIIFLTMLYFATITHKWDLFPSLRIICNNLLLVPNGIAIRALVNFMGLKSLFLVIISLSILVFITNRNPKFTRFVTLIAIILFTLVTLSIRFVQSEIRFSQHREWTNTQLWVQKNTNFDSKFVLDGDLDTYASWTTLARRPRLTSLNGPQTIYLYSKASVELDTIRKRTGISPSVNSDSNSIEKFYKDFAIFFGGEYLVRRAEWTELNWQVVYQNSKYIIYKIPNLNN